MYLVEQDEQKTFKTGEKRLRIFMILLYLTGVGLSIYWFRGFFDIFYGNIHFLYSQHTFMLVALISLFVLIYYNMRKYHRYEWSRIKKSMNFQFRIMFIVCISNSLHALMAQYLLEMSGDEYYQCDNNPIIFVTYRALYFINYGMCIPQLILAIVVIKFKSRQDIL